MIKLTTRFHTMHKEAWRNKVARELNLLLETTRNENRAAVLSVVQRVAAFEGIETVEEPQRR